MLKDDGEWSFLKKLIIFFLTTTSQHFSVFLSQK